jgi:hypothetical protein
MGKLRFMEGGRVGFWCPGCKEGHQVRVQGEGRPMWGYNGNPESPTFTPSVLVNSAQIERDEKGEWTGEWIYGADGKPLPMVCHTYVTDGQIQFLSDCTHELAGRTVPLPDFPD